MAKQQQQQQRKQLGQSLTEVALFLPLFIVLISGLAEVGQYLLTANRVSTAARASARFAANGGQDEGVRDIALNTVTQTLPLDEDLWDLWSIRGSVNVSGTGFNDDWAFEHIYGVGATETYSEVNEVALQKMVLDELQKDDTGTEQQVIAAGVEFAGSYVSYDAESILGLNQFLGEFFTVTDLNIMRTFPYEPNTNGCTAFPIMVGDGVRSVTDPDDDSDVETDFPDADQFHHPADPPSYGDFTLHDPNLPFESASEGDVFYLKLGSGSGSFGWAFWNTYNSANAPDLAASLSWPGNSTDYTSEGSGPWPQELVDQYGTDKPVVGYINPNDITDSSLGLTDLVSVKTGSVNSSDVNAALVSHIDNERVLRVMVWDESVGTGVNTTYKIKRFVLVRLIGYRLQGGNDSWILAEFIRIDESCGQ